MNIVLWHNILWSPYKAGVFSALANLAAQRADSVLVYQICETDSEREGLSAVDRSIHAYPHQVLFARSYDRVFAPLLWARVLSRTIRESADVTVISGIHRPEYWLQAAFLALAGRKRAVFCDSTMFDRRQTALKSLAKRIFFKMVPNTLSYGSRARDYVIAHGVAPDRALIRCQAAFLPASYDAATIVAERAVRSPEKDAPVFLYVGRLAPEKDIRMLLAAFDQLATLYPRARLRLVGSGPKEAILRDRVAAMTHGAQVDFVGPRLGEALHGEYLSATALVLPSRSEPWGLVVNEALHFGCPVIVSDRCGCVPELVEGSPCGMTFPSGDTAALADALRAAVNWADQPETVAQTCLDRIAPYSAEASARQTLDALERIRKAA